MLAGNDGAGPSARRKRAMVSCRECHRRKEKCDRRQPCIRCIRRGKKHACLYELEDEHVRSPLAPIERHHHATHGVQQSHSDSTLEASSTMGDELRVLGYARDRRGTPGIIHNLGESTNMWPASCSRSDPALGQYACIVRELPPLRHVDILVQAFFRNVAWHYDIVDEATFTDQHSRWRSLTYKQLKLAPDSLPASLRYFPALLFQVLAQALLFQPAQYDRSLDDLKYAADMELSDRAVEYSDAGNRLASLFGKSDITLTTVQAELMRACFQKTSGAVIEAWHTLGGAIRNAQELGLHQLEPEVNSHLTNEIPERETGCKVWLMLHLWDAHMAVVLGRPMSTRMNPEKVPLPAPYDSNSGAPMPPQPRDVILCGYHTAYKFLQDIHGLERVDDWRPSLENIHQALLTNIANLPSWASAQRLRQLEPPWLSAALEMMFTNIQFVLFALHRPFVFVESSNRAKAVLSAMQVLESQKRLFDQTEPLQYKAFSLIFATFDAMVLIAAVHIRYSDEFIGHLPATIVTFESVLERLKLLQYDNKLAGPALDVIQRLYQRMLAVVPTGQSSLTYTGSEEGNNFWRMETGMSSLDWNEGLQPEFGNVLHPQPLNELLHNGASTVHPALLAEPSHGLHQSPFEFLNIS